MKNRLLSTFRFLVILALILIPVQPTQAQDGSGQSDWAGFLNPDGTMRSDLVDLGETQMEASWMPNLSGDFLNPFSDGFMDPYAQPGEATFHRYMDPATGNIVVVPSASTLMFMGANADASGLSASSGQLGLGAGLMLEGMGTILAGQFNLDLGWVQSMGYRDSNQFMQSVINGETNIFSLPFSSSLTNFIMQLVGGGINDGNIYTAMLMYNPGACASMPGGCPPELSELLKKLPCQGSDCPVDEDPCFPGDPKCDIKVPECAEPQVFPGIVSTSARYLAPDHPIVVGQDPEKRGVDLEFTITVPPTKVVYEELVEEEGGYCTVEISYEGFCPKDKWVGPEEPEFECVQHEVSYRESVVSAAARASLTANSRAWITGELASRYPGATIKHPDWAWSNGQGGFQGDTYIWRLTIPGVQVADPGFYSLDLSGLTSGTPVGPARNFGGAAGQFGVYLLEATIIQ
jgi:hypothetical protein